MTSALELIENSHKYINPMGYVLEIKFINTTRASHVFAMKEPTRVFRVTCIFALTTNKNVQSFEEKLTQQNEDIRRTIESNYLFL